MKELAVTIDTNQLKRDVAINITDLTSAMMDQSGLFAHYAQLCADAQRQMDRAKIAVELTEARVHHELTREAHDAGTKTTEAALSKALMRNGKMVKVKMQYADAKMIHALAKEALEAFKQRRDMLIQIGVNAREEMKGELRIQAIEANAQGVEAKRQNGRNLIGSGKKDAV